MTICVRRFLRDDRLKIALLLGLIILGCRFASAHAEIPPPVENEKLAVVGAKPEQLTVAGGCFWGVQAVFQHIKGVTGALSGYAGGKENTAHYDMVSGGATGHAEAVQITYDPSQVTLGALLQVFFAVAHDPTQLNYQGPDHGTQYRSAIFYATPEQKKIAESYIAQLNDAHFFADPIVTTMEPLQGFYAAEAYHQDFARRHPDYPYIRNNDAPKLMALKQRFPILYSAKE